MAPNQPTLRRGTVPVPGGRGLSKTKDGGPAAGAVLIPDDRGFPSPIHAPAGGGFRAIEANLADIQAGEIRRPDAMEPGRIKPREGRPVIPGSPRHL